jgi:hypothetical protein
MEAMEEIHTMIEETRRKRIPGVRLARLDKVEGKRGLGEGQGRRCILEMIEVNYSRS